MPESIVSYGRAGLILMSFESRVQTAPKPGNERTKVKNFVSGLCSVILHGSGAGGGGANNGIMGHDAR
jgi:hypothetical protein